MHTHLRLDTSPVARPDNVIAGDTWRITLLDAGLVRLEHDPDGLFEDRASQMALHRDMPAVAHSVVDGDRLEIDTERLHLVYDRGPFSARGLSVQVRGGVTSYHSTWRPGMGAPGLATDPNLGGTARTLDLVDGRADLGHGPLSRNGIAVIDDSSTLLLEPDGWFGTRRPGTTDLYVFAFGLDHRAALAAFHAVTGPQPLVPRSVLGNWWSRFHEYTADSYLDLMDRFEAAGYPFSVAVIDMDWHLVDIPPELGSGWTGYTWNTKLFPDPPGFLAALHERGMATTLNVHPADGIRAHESAYEAMATRMGIDPDSGRPVAFDVANPEFLAAYLEEVHHPLEADGVDFWWVDWQQGGIASMEGMDPLWVLNHFHWLDSGRRGGRHVTFSRYAGLGSHRYPIGFSGDSVTSWASLAFQPEMTATAANVGYGWWSHDLGGHFSGDRDPELALRWVQLGVFSPITRLHSGKDAFNRREPWAWPTPIPDLMRSMLRWRHRMLPWLATMARRTHTDGTSLVRPMYHDHPDVEAAYEVPTQYRFGDELLVAPITKPVATTTQLAHAKGWLPPGAWIDLFTGLAYDGDRHVLLHRSLDSIPVLAHAGAILPMVPDEQVAWSTDVPAALEIWVVAGADGTFELAEDRDDDRWATTAMHWDQDAGELTIEAVSGVAATVPEERHLQVVLVGFNLVTSVRANVDGVPRDITATTDRFDHPGTRHDLGLVGRDTRVVVHVEGDLTMAGNDVVAATFDLLDAARIELTEKNELHRIVRTAATPAAAVVQVQAVASDDAVAAALTEVLLAREPRSS